MFFGKKTNTRKITPQLLSAFVFKGTVGQPRQKYAIVVWYQQMGNIWKSGT